MNLKMKLFKYYSLDCKMPLLKISTYSLFDHISLTHPIIVRIPIQSVK